MKDVRSELGKPIRRYFDNGTSLVELYQLAPGSTVAVSEPANTFDVSQITVHYSGPYLPPVSAQDQVQAKLFRLKQIDHHLTRGNTERGFALLQDQVTDYPQDITAHLSLADALRRKCSVNASFAEYRRVLSMAQAAGDVDAQKQAIKALSPYGLVPANLAIVRPVSLDSTLVKVSPTGAAPTLTAAKAGSNLQ